MSKNVGVALLGATALILSACSHGGPSDAEVKQAFAVYGANMTGQSFKAIAPDVNARMELDGCKADDNHSTDSAPAYLCDYEYRGSPGSKTKTLQITLQSGQWRITNITQN